MNRFFISFFAFVSLYVFVGCSQGEPNESIIKACKEKNIVVDRIVFQDTIKSEDVKSGIQELISYFDGPIECTEDSGLIKVICPEAFKIRDALEKMLSYNDYAYLRYKVYGKYNEHPTEVYALVSYIDSLIYPIKVVNEWDEVDIVNELNTIRPSALSAIEKVNSLLSKSHEELQAIADGKIQEAEMLRESKLERTNRPTTWEDVAILMKEKGCTSITIYKGMDAYAGTLAFYKKNGNAYLAACSLSDYPVDFEYSDKLKKINGNTYIFSEPGSDMPEKFVFNGTELITYCYNPEAGEWVNMGSYYQVY
ncbi:MAG: hypothetical protein KBT20_08830 [Bacteroidales bacterium]|nr:hypothetical protein [Candidatus Liminaster caballi]